MIPIFSINCHPFFTQSPHGSRPSPAAEAPSRAGYAAASSETADLRSESSTSMQGGAEKMEANL